MSLIQLVLVLFFLFALAKVIKRFRAHELTTSVTIGWIIFWGLAIIVVLIPNSTAAVAKVAGIGRGADLVVYVALAALFYNMFRLTVRVERLNRDLTRVTRELALRDSEKKIV